MENINVTGLASGCQQFLPGSVYLFQSKSDLLPFDILLNRISEQTSKHFFIISPIIDKLFSSESDYQADLLELDRCSQLQSFSYQTNFAQAMDNDVIKQLFKELSYYPQCHDSTMFFHLTSQALIYLTPVKLSKLLQRLDLFVKQKNMTLVLILTGALLGEYRSTLRQLNNIITGMAVIDINATVTTIHYDYWHHFDGVLYNKEYKLLHQDNSVIAQPIDNLLDNETTLATELLDLNDVLICKDVIPEHTVLPPQYKVIASNDGVYNQGLTEAGATLVFSVTRDSDLQALAAKCFKLRKRCGRWLKVVIKNVDGVIRHQDECLFLTIGVNLILHRGKDISRMLSQIQAIQGFQFSRHLPNYFEDVQQLTTTVFKKGYLPPNAYINEVSHLRDSASTLGVSGVLIVLELIPAIEPVHTLVLFNLQREGDLLSASTHQIYLYLHACRENDVSSALERLFKLNVSEFFIAHRIYSQELAIEEQFSGLRQAIADQRAPDYTDKLEQGATKAKQSINKDTAVKYRDVALNQERESSKPYSLTLKTSSST